MTLHEAIEFVLREERKPLKALEIAYAINSKKLYLKSDNTDVTSNQIRARVAKYPEIFIIDENGIALHDLSIKPYRDFVLRFTDLLKTSGYISDTMKIQELAASFLFLIYYARKNINLKPSHTDNFRTLQLAFGEIQFEHPKTKNVLDGTINFLSNSLSEFEKENILRLIDYYNFDFLEKPSNEEFSSFFNDVVNAFSWKTNFRGGEYSTPKLVSVLMTSMYELPPHSKVFDPFAGKASILTDLIRKHKNNVFEVRAVDINPYVLNVGFLNIYVTGFRNFEYTRGNSLSEWEEYINADFIFSNPPLSGRSEELFNYNNWQFQPTSDISLNAMQLALFHLNPTGKALLIMPESFLFGTKKEAVAIRAKLINENLLHAVISLPKNIFKPYAQVNTALVIIDKEQRSKKTGVYVYDASGISVDDFKKEIIEITNAFHSEATILDKARWVSKSEIENNSYDLTIKRYLLKPLKYEENYILLNHLLEDFFIGNYIPSDNINKEEGIPYIQVGDLIDGEGLGSIRKDDLKSFISDIELVNTTQKKIPKGAILISKVGTKLKPTMFEGDYDAFASSNIIVLKPGKNVLTEYLVSQFQSKYVKNQIEAIRRYNAIPNFNLKELLNIRIQNIPLEQQAQYITGYYSKKVSEIEKLENKSKEDELFNLISRIKHEVKQPVSSIGIDINVLEAYLKSKEETGNPLRLNDFALEPLEGQILADIEATRISNILRRIKKSVEEAQQTLQKAEETLNIGKGALKLEAFEIKEFIESSIMPLYVNANCIIELEGKAQVINADKYQLKIIFKHLIENSLKHGFVYDKPKEQNIIRIELKKETKNDFAEIILMNNGKPFSPGFNKTLFETKGLTSDRNNGSGFGGYHIKIIIENHKGEFQIADDEEVQFSEFKVKFKIYLPLTI